MKGNKRIENKKREGMIWNSEIGSAAGAIMKRTTTGIFAVCRTFREWD